MYSVTPVVRTLHRITYEDEAYSRFSIQHIRTWLKFNVTTLLVIVYLWGGVVRLVGATIEFFVCIIIRVFSDTLNSVYY